MPPTLLLVHGLPASGKTTLARYLAQQTGWPIVHKDDVKEILFDTLGWSDRARSRELGVATTELLFAMVNLQLSAGVSFIVENNFKPESASPRLRGILARTGALSIQVLCKVESDVRLKRFQGRARHPGHADFEVDGDAAQAFLKESLAPLDLGGPVIEVDTTDLSKIDYPAIFAQVQRDIEDQSAK